MPDAATTGLRWFYITTAANHPKGSGYWRVRAANRDHARKKAFGALGAKWAFQYDSLEEVHPLDRTHHGDIE